MSYRNEQHGLDSNAERLPGEFPLPGTEALAGARPGQEECDTCGKVTWLVIHSCIGVPRTDAAKQRWADRHGYASWAEAQQAGRPRETKLGPLQRDIIDAAVAYVDRGDESVDFHNALVAAVGTMRGAAAPHPVHPRAEDQWMRTSAVPGLTVAVDRAGCIVLHSDLGSMTVTNVDSLVEDLRAAQISRTMLEGR